MKRLLFSICVLIQLSYASAQVDLLIYSYNRPFQLYALLESIYKYVSNLDQIMVIYRSSDHAYAQAYEIVKSDFYQVKFFKQRNAPEDFKPLTLQCISSSNPYILFAVDDIVVKDYINIADCIDLMEQYQTYGFFLRLGKHLNYSYATFSDQSLPSFTHDSESICVWNFDQAQGDWGYPNSLDMTIYRKAELMSLLRSLDYSSPNQLEHYLAMRADYSKKGICYESSKIINLPINVVQTYTHNNCVNSYSTQDLLDLFNFGIKMDIDAFYKVQNRSSHMFDGKIQFKQR